MVANYQNSADAKVQLADAVPHFGVEHLVSAGVLCAFEQAEAMTTGAALGEFPTARLYLKISGRNEGVYVALTAPVARGIAESLSRIADLLDSEQVPA